jgi:antitoxin CptB
LTESIELRRKRLRFRSWHRGTREADLVLGSFADRHLADLDTEQLAAYERLLDEPEPDLWDWISGTIPPPERHANDLMRLLQQFDYMRRPA